MTERHTALTVVTRAGLTALAVLVAAGALTVAAGPAAASTPSLSCADGEGGVYYTAPSNLTVADDTNATVHGPFVANGSITLDNVTFRAAGDTFARFHGHGTDGGTCLSAVNATATPLTVETGTATLTIEGRFDALAFDEPTVGGDVIAYRTTEPATVTIADSGVESGTTIVAVDADGNAVTEATVAADGSLSLTLPTRTGETRLRLQTVQPETTARDTGTDDETPNEESPDGPATTGTVPGMETTGATSPGFGLALSLVAVVGALVLLTVQAPRR